MRRRGERRHLLSHDWRAAWHAERLRVRRYRLRRKMRRSPSGCLHLPRQLRLLPQRLLRGRNGHARRLVRRRRRLPRPADADVRALQLRPGRVQRQLQRRFRLRERHLVLGRRLCPTARARAGLRRREPVRIATLRRCRLLRYGLYRPVRGLRREWQRGHLHARRRRPAQCADRLRFRRFGLRRHLRRNPSGRLHVSGQRHDVPGSVLQFGHRRAGCVMRRERLVPSRAGRLLRPEHVWSHGVRRQLHGRFRLPLRELLRRGCLHAAKRTGHRLRRGKPMRERSVRRWRVLRDRLQWAVRGLRRAWLGRHLHERDRGAARSAAGLRLRRQRLRRCLRRVERDRVRVSSGGDELPRRELRRGRRHAAGRL